MTHKDPDRGSPDCGRGPQTRVGVHRTGWGVGSGGPRLGGKGSPDRVGVPRPGWGARESQTGGETFEALD